MTDLANTDGQSEDRIVTLRRSEIRAIEKKAKERDDYAAQLEAAQRRLAFAEAGLPLDDKRLTYFVKAYDGELSRDAILTAAREAGFLQTEQPPAAPPVDPVERNALSAIYSASQGAGVPTPGDLEAQAATVFEQGGVAALSQFLAQQGVPLSQD